MKKVDYKTPFAQVINTRNATSDHTNWQRHRSSFVASGNLDELDKMLNFVTPDNPPLAPKPQREDLATKLERYQTDIWNGIVLVLGKRPLLFLALLGLALTVFCLVLPS